MADAPAEKQVEDVEVVADAVSDAALQALFRNPGQVGDEPTPVPEPAPKPPEPTPPEPPAPAVDAGRLAALEQQLQQMRERQVGLETENNIYRMGLLERQQQQQPAQRKSLLEEVGYTQETLNEGLRSNAAATIADLLEKTNQKAYERAKTEAVNEATAQVSGLNNQNQAFLADQRATTVEYGELLNSNAEFKDRAEKIYADLTESGVVINRSGTRWTPRAMYTAVSMAYAQMAKAGKFNSNGNNVVKLDERRKLPVSPVTGEASNTGGDAGRGGAASGGGAFFADHDSSQVTQVKATCSRLGTSFEKYVSRYNQLKKENPGYGGGY